MRILTHISLCLLVPQMFAPTHLARAEDYTNTQESGPVRVTTSLSPIDPIIGDELTLRVEVQAEPDVEVLMPEFEEIVSGFPVAEWVPKQQFAPDGASVQSVQYKFSVTASGNHAIAPILIEFVDNRPGKKKSPDDFDAYEILTERIDFSVQSIVPQGAAQELKPPLGELELPTEKLSGSTYLVWIIPLAVGVSMALAWSFLIRRKKVRKANAYELARERLQRILNDRAQPSPSLSIEQFFVEISAVIRRYLEDRFELRAPDLTTDEFLQLSATESDLSREHQNLLSEFLQQADIVKFAGVQATPEDMERSSQIAVQFLEDTRSNAPEIELQEEPSPKSAEARSEASHV